MIALRFRPDGLTMVDLKKYFADQPFKARIAGRDALNRTMEQVRTITTTALAGTMGTKKSSIMTRVRVFEATVDDLSSSMKLSGKRGLNLANMGARQTKAGITVRIYGSPVKLPHAFLAPGLGGTKSVFIRDGNKRAMVKGKYAGRKIVHGPRAGQPLLRQPLETQYGPNVADEWRYTPGMQNITADAINAFLPKNIKQQMRRFS